MLLPLFSLLMDFSKLFLPRDNTEPSINQVESHVLKNQDSTVLTPHPWRCCRREGSSQEPSPARCAPHPPHPSGLFLCLPRASFPPIPPPLPQSQFAVFSYAILASVFHYSLKPQISGQQYGIWAAGQLLKYIPRDSKGPERVLGPGHQGSQGQEWPLAPVRWPSWQGGQALSGAGRLPEHHSGTPPSHQGRAGISLRSEVPAIRRAEVREPACQSHGASPVTSVWTSKFSHDMSGRKANPTIG